MKNKTVLRKVVGAYRCTQFDGNVSHLQTWLNQWAEERYEVETYNHFLKTSSGFNIPECDAVVFDEQEGIAYPVLNESWICLYECDTLCTVLQLVVMDTDDFNEIMKEI